VSSWSMTIRPSSSPFLRMLDFLGFAGVPAESGGEALRLIATKPDIGLVLADFAMPEMNGVELARAVHAVAVIPVTGYCDHDLLKEFGDSRILQKPYT
jgi:CheY-like chemotaxis protein